MSEALCPCCDGRGFILRDAGEIDACPDCAAAAEIEYRLFLDAQADRKEAA